ncbi:MAG: c-type cytochrome [Bacillota bacterium]
MNTLNLRKSTWAVLFVSALAACGGAPSQPAAAPERVQALQAQVDDLSRELTRLHNAVPADQEGIMHGYWDMLQRQLLYVRRMPGIVARGCTDWTLMDPAVMGRAAAGGPAPCPTVHAGAPADGWPFPADMTPKLFEVMMQHQLEMLRSQVAAIVAEPDDNKRIYLIRDHYDTRYQDIQMALGRSWMWTPYDPATLPESQTMGAQLLQQYCSQCHLAPRPDLYTRAEWQRITRTMHDIIQSQSRTEIMGVRMPASDEFDLIVSYLESHAHVVPAGP